MRGRGKTGEEDKASEDLLNQARGNFWATSQSYEPRHSRGHPLKRLESGQSAFSLAEVMLALGVAAVCMLAIVGLISVGIDSNQTTIAQTVAANIARAVMVDLRGAPLSTGSSRQFGFVIPGSGPPSATSTAIQTLYFFETGSASGKIGDSPKTIGNNSRYRCDAWFTSPPSGRTATSVRLLITWPALTNQDPSIEPTNYAGAIEFVTALDRN